MIAYPECNFLNWVRSIANKPTFAGCRFCLGSIIDLSNMVVQALESHSELAKHAKANALFLLLAHQ